jgi:hypothetical protein
MIGMVDQTGPGRPRKWADNAERMRAYRASEHERRDPLRGDHSVVELAGRVVELTGERDRLWAQVVRLQQRITQLENALAGHPPIDTPADPPTAATGPQSGLSRAERRRLEREQQRRQPHR